MYIHDYAWRYYIYIHTHNYVYIYTIIYRLRNVLADIKWTGKKNNKWTALAGFEPVTICFRDCFKMPRELWGGRGGRGGLDCSVLCDGCACEGIEQSINETCMHKSKYYVYK